MDMSIPNETVSVEESKKIEKFDYNYFFNKAKEYWKVGSLDSMESSITHIEAAIDNLRAVQKYSKDKSVDSWLKKFLGLEIKVRTEYYAKKIKILTEKAEKEEEIYKHEKALKFYESIGENMHEFFKLGNNKVSKEDIKRIASKINELKGKISHEEQMKQISEQKTAEDEDNNEFVGIDAEFEEIDLDSNQKKQATPFFAPTESPILFDNEEEEVEEATTEGDFEAQEVVIPEFLVENIVQEKDFEPSSILDDISIPEEGVVEDQEEDFSLDDVSLSSEPMVIQEKYQKEIVAEDSFNLVLSNARRTLESLNYYILLPDSAELTEIYDLIDLVALKVINVSEFLYVCKVVILKISKLSGPLIVSESKVRYASPNLSTLEGKELVSAIKKKLIDASDKITTDLRFEGPFAADAINYIDEDVTLERDGLSKKGLFYRKGRMEYKFSVTPIVLASGKVKFLEKNIPYSVQREDGAYFVQIEGFRDLLNYFDKKELSIEKICVKKQPIKLFLVNKQKLGNGLRLIGIILGFYAFVFLFSVITLNLPLITVLNSMSYPFLGAIAILAVVMISNYKKNQGAISRSFCQNFSANHPDFSEKRFIIALDQVSPLEREQFLYEVYGKKHVPISIQEKAKTKISQDTFTELFDTDFVKFPTKPSSFTGLKEIYRDLETKHDYSKAYCALRGIFVVKLRSTIHSYLDKPLSAVESVHDVLKLLQVVDSADFYHIERNLRGRLQRWETMRKKRERMTKDQFDSAKRDLLKVMSDLQDSVDEKVIGVETNTGGDVEFLKDEGQHQDSIKSFLED